MDQVAVVLKDDYFQCFKIDRDCENIESIPVRGEVRPELKELQALKDEVLSREYKDKPFSIFVLNISDVPQEKYSDFKNIDGCKTFWSLSKEWLNLICSISNNDSENCQGEDLVRTCLNFKKNVHDLKIQKENLQNRLSDAQKQIQNLESDMKTSQGEKSKSEQMARKKENNLRDEKNRLQSEINELKNSFGLRNTCLKKRFDFSGEIFVEVLKKCNRCYHATFKKWEEIICEPGYKNYKWLIQSECIIKPGEAYIEFERLDGSKNRVSVRSGGMLICHCGRKGSGLIGVIVDVSDNVQEAKSVLKMLHE
ncbi:hypothetical protein SAMN05720764_103170 [Fibrobacter sp. UWH5]|uniref:hypothetical protein n=1 Tax=Fibrobacter sp. UWH5 TaxID=1896211 RepID=UPI0009146090|nr:hypothetical protein [Fibrobacter sp. UWH5]SHK73652.1 hypothetical protein SAMN05720764_103170 [Fibrobacter sp. UWH5]